MGANLTPGEPVWGMALLFPPQGSWTEVDYLELDAGRVVDPKMATITVLSGLESDAYAEDRVFGVGDVATSQALADFRVPVEEAMAAAEPQQ